MILILYFAPTILAMKHRTRNRQMVAALNILAGWTLIGWVIAFVMAYSPDRDQVVEAK